MYLLMQQISVCFFQWPQADRVAGVKLVTFQSKQELNKTGDGKINMEMMKPVGKHEQHNEVIMWSISGVYGFFLDKKSF